MRRLLIGSRALRHHGIGNRDPKDTDWFADHKPLTGDTYWDDAFTEWLPDGTDRVATIDELYTIKLSHAYWELRNGSWSKHMHDLLLLKDAGAQVEQGLHDLLYSTWERLHGVKKVDLTMPVSVFFADAVHRKYDHDSLHRTVAYNETPLYETVLAEGATVRLDMARVWALPFTDQIRLFREEVFVTALERVIIPSGYLESPRRAYAWALRRTITSLTKGRSAQFIAEHYRIFRTPDMDYVRHHLANRDKLIALEVAA